MSDIKNMTPKEKRTLINKLCDAYPSVYKDGKSVCSGCPLDEDSEAWCKRGYSEDIKDEDLDAILKSMQLRTESNEMMTPEDIRKRIIGSLLPTPTLGENYIDWHDDEGKCGVTIMYPDQQFDIIITRKEVEK